MMNPRRITLTLGAAAGGLLAAALIPMATASAITDTEPDPFTDLGLANGAALDAITPSSLASPLDGFIDASGINFAEDDFFADLGVPGGSFLDSLFVSLGLGPLDGIWDSLSGLDPGIMG